MSILLNSSAMRSLVNSLMLGNHSHHHHHKKENSFSSTEVMSTITESSNSSIDSGTFDVYDDPEDHFYDEPLLSNDFDYQFDDIDQQFKSIQLQQQQQQLSNSKPPGFSVDDDTSTVIKSFLLETVNKSVNQESSSLNNHKQLEVKSDFLNQNNLNSATTKQLTSITNNNSNIKKPRPPKPPRHIKNPSSSAKLINCEQTLVDTKSNDQEKRNLNNLQLTLPPKGVKLSSSSSISSGISSKSSSPIPLTPLSPKAKSPFLLTSSNQSIQSQQYQQEQVQQQSQPQLTKPSRKPIRPPPPVPDQPREEKKSSKVSSKQLIEEDLSTNKSTKPGPVKEVIIDCLKNNQIDNQISNDSSKAIESSSNMAVLNRSRSGQGSFYETAFDSSKVIIHGDSLHHHNNRDQMNHLNGNNNNNSHNNHHHPHHFNHHAHPNHNSSVSNQAQQQQIITTYRRGSETSVTSFTPEASSRSSTASSTTSSNGHESGYSTPKHLDQLPKALLPRRQGIKSTVHIPRSKSSDVTLNLTAAAPPTLPSSATASSSSSSSSPVNQLDVESKPPSSTAGEIKRNRSKMNSLSTFSMLKSATSDALSSLDCEAGRYLIRTRSNLDSLRMSLKERNNNYNRISSNDDNVLDSGRINGSIKTLNLSSASININNGSSANNNHTTLSTINSASNNNLTTNNNNNKKQSTEKKPATANRSFRRLELKLNEVRNSVSLSNAQQLQSPLNDTRPLDDYDTPWDSNQRLNKVFNKLINTPTSEKIGNEFLPVNSVKCKTPLVESNPISLVSGGGDACQQQTDQTANHQQQQEQSTISNHQQRKGSNGSTDSTSLVVAEGDNNNSQQQQHKSCSASPVDPVKVDNRLDKIRKLSLPLNLKNGSSNNQNNNSNGTNSSAPRANLNLDLSNSTVTTPTASDNSSQAIKFGLGSRKKPFLSFTGQPLPAVSEDIDTTLVLEKQGWYHGSITRLDAENLLRNMKEGSYLIRNCESTKQDYSLSLKSVKGFMHMKIVKQSDGKYILGVFSKPFSNIPEMVKHYSINKLPIRGAEHMSLLYPVIDQLL